jgi:hypothetical protein
MGTTEGRTHITAARSAAYFTRPILIHYVIKGPPQEHNHSLRHQRTPTRTQPFTTSSKAPSARTQPFTTSSQTKDGLVNTTNSDLVCGTSHGRH